MSQRGDELDPKGLIRESYLIEGITAEECRSIFVDWALSLPEGVESRAACGVLLARHGGAPAHPMTGLLRAGMAEPPKRRRRGGRRGRIQ